LQEKKYKDRNEAIKNRIMLIAITTCFDKGPNISSYV